MYTCVSVCVYVCECVRLCVAVRKEKEAINLKESESQDEWRDLKGGEWKGEIV